MDRGRSKRSPASGAARPDARLVARPGARTDEPIPGTASEFSRSTERPAREAASRDASIEDILIAHAIPELADRHVFELSGRQPHRSGRAEPVGPFVEALLDDASEAWQALAEAALAECRDPQIVAARLFQPAARLIGDQWRADEVDFLQVTIAVTRMQRMFTRMTHDHPPAVEPCHSRRILLSPTPGDQHAFGLAVVEDAFRRAGWDVDCCACDEGANLYRLAASNDYRLIGLSVNVGRLLPELASIVARLRAGSVNRSVVMMGGGSLFADHPGWAADAGFDLSAADALSAVSLAEAAVASQASRDDVAMAAE